MKVRNKDVLGGPRELPDNGLFVENGDVVEVPDALGESLIQQTEVWERVEDEPKKDEPKKKAKDS
jgi:hypothetical protein